MITHNTLNHLPTAKREELDAIAAIICRECPDVAMIILFGSYARGDWKDGPHQQGRGRLTIHKKSDYDILAITRREATARDARLWQAIKQQCGGQASTYVRIIPRDIDFVNDKLMEGQYFFTEIIEQGVLLHDRGHYRLEDKRSLDPQKARCIAQANFEEIFIHTAREFLVNGVNAFDRGSYKIAAFELNQACEHAYKTVLLVFANECPQEHHLDILGNLAGDYCPPLRGIFPQNTQAWQALFELLDYAYIGARYDRHYTISHEQVEQLLPCVRQLHRVVERHCREKIEGFTESGG